MATMATDATTLIMTVYHTALPIAVWGIFYILCIKRILQVSEKKQNFRGAIVPGKFFIHYECPNNKCRHRINFDKDKICPKCGEALWIKE